jgi:hypothetical protein
MSTGRRTVRIVASALLLAIGSVALAAAIASHWTRTVLLDTDTFMAAVEPLARDEAMLDSAAESVSDEVLRRLDLRALAEPATPDALMPIVEEIAVRFETFVRAQVRSAIRSQSYATLWRTTLRGWHAQFAAAVTARSNAEPTMDGAEIRVSLGPYIDVMAENTDEWLLRSVLRLVPDEIRATQVTVMRSQPLADRLPLLRALVRARTYLPWVAGLAFIGAIVVAPRRWLGLAGAGAGVALAGIAPYAWLSAERLRVIDLLAANLGASPEAIAQTVDALAAPLFEWLLYTGLAGAVIALVGLIAARVTRLPR